VVKRVLGGRNARADAESEAVALEAARGRALVEESREIVVVLDDERRVVAASRRAREALPGLRIGEPVPTKALEGRRPLEIGYEALGRGETLLYLSEPAENAAYEELRAGFTAAVSHELRTPLARLLALLESAELPGAEREELIRQAIAEVTQMGELIDDVLFLSELETGRAVVAFGSTRFGPVLSEVFAELADSAERAGVGLRSAGDGAIELPVRPRMLRVVLENLLANAIRYAGPGATCTVTIAPGALTVADDGTGVNEHDLGRLFERFYRTDRARASRGTGLGLAIVKHIVTTAGGSVEARTPRGGGLEIRCTFPQTV
jgi:two-component system, OmpR family, phosphate regulon sensor histidine kinase PhoR